MTKDLLLFRLLFVSTFVAVVSGFLNHLDPKQSIFKASSTRRYFFDKIFEEEGVLGKGITVGKVQVALISPTRSSDSVFGLLERKAANSGDSPEQLSRLANDVCLTLLRKSDDWISACSSSKWFSEKDAGKAESYFNDLANSEALKYEKVRIEWLQTLWIFLRLNEITVTNLMPKFPSRRTMISSLQLLTSWLLSVNNSPDDL